MGGTAWGVNEFSFLTLPEQGLEDLAGPPGARGGDMGSLEGTMGPDEAETLL